MNTDRTTKKKKKNPKFVGFNRFNDFASTKRNETRWTPVDSIFALTNKFPTQILVVCTEINKRSTYGKMG